MSRRVIIVGAGVTGLSTAWYLQRAAEERSVPLACTVLEREARVGGKVLTRRLARARGTFLVEAGADSFLTHTKPWAVELAVSLDLTDRLIGTNEDARRVLVLRHGRLCPLPEGILLLVPTKLGPFVRSRLLSPWGKLRTAADLVLPRRRDPGDETLAAFVTRRLGAEVLDRIAEPLLSGIYNADAGRQSVLATLPRLRQMEADHRSLILAALRARRAHSAAPSTAVREAGTTAAARIGGSIFASFVGGTAELTERLRERVAADLRLCSRAVGLQRAADGTFRVAVVRRAPGAPAEIAETLGADAVVLCAPTAETAALLGAVAPASAALVASIRSTSTGSISLGYEGCVVPPQDLGFGLVVPSSERRPINAVTYSSVKLPGRAPDGASLLRVFFGGSRSPQTMALGDDDVFAVARQQLRALLGIVDEPLFWQVDRWMDAQPQYDVGHLDLVRSVEENLPAGLWVAGSPFRGVGIPDCVRQGRDAAREVVDFLR